MIKLTCSQVLPVDELNRIISTDGNHELYPNEYLKRNSVGVFNLSDDRIILKSTSIDMKEGLMLKDRACLNEMLEQDYFPIDDPRAQAESFSSPDNFHKISKYDLEAHLIKNYGLEVVTSSITIEDVKIAFSKIEKGHEPKDNDEFNMLFLCLGWAILNEHGGEWAFVKHYGHFNPFYWPVIITDTELIEFYSELNIKYFDKSYDFGSNDFFELYVARQFGKKNRGFRISLDRNRRKIYFGDE